jgi:hypothetical protein
MNGCSVIARGRSWWRSVLMLAAVMIAPHAAYGQASTATIEDTIAHALTHARHNA